MRGVLRRACCLLLAQSNSARIAKTTRVLLFCQLLFGQFTPGAYGSVSRLYGYGSRLYGRIAGPPDLVARDRDFAALLVSDVRLAARLGPRNRKQQAAASPRREILFIVIPVANADLSAGVAIRHSSHAVCRGPPIRGYRTTTSLVSL